MKPIDLDLVDIGQYNEERYQQLLTQYNQQPPNYVFFESLGVKLLNEQVNPFLNAKSRVIQNEVMKFVIQYLNYIHQTSPKGQKIFIMGFDITLYNEQSGDFEYTRLTGLGPSKKFSELITSGYTHILYFVKYQGEWFPALVDIKESNFYSFCPDKKVQQDVWTLTNQIFVNDLAYDKLLIVDLFESLEGYTLKPSYSINLIYQMMFFVKTGKYSLQHLDVNNLHTQKLLDWLLLEIAHKYQNQVPQKEKSFIEEKKPSFANMSKQEQMMNSKEFEKTLAKSMRERQASQIMKVNKLQPMNYSNYIQQLKDDELRIKRDKEQFQRKQQYGSESIQLSRADFIYMMEKYKSDVINDLKNTKSQETNFLADYLYQNGSILQPVEKQNGALDYNVQLTPDQLNDLLSKYEAHNQRQQQIRQEAEVMKQQQEQYNSFVQFQQLLNFYYQTNPTLYQELLDDYNRRLHQQLLDAMGLPISNQKVIEQNNNRQSQSVKRIIKYSQKKFMSNAQFNISGIQQSKSQYFSPNISKLKPLQNNSQLARSRVDPTKDAFQKNDHEDIIASRYDKKIFMNEFLRFKHEQIVSENMLNFFIRYLEEKQQNLAQQTLKQFGLRVFFLTTSFFKQLTSKSLDPNYINYESAAFYTQQYIGKNNTIFDHFDLVLVPIPISVKEFSIALINLQKREITYFDSLINGDAYRQIARSQNEQLGLMSNPNLVCILRFLERESNEKLMKNLDLLKYNFRYSPHEKVIDIKQSGLLTASVIHQICQGNLVTLYTGSRSLEEFHSKLVELIKRIGNTKNKKNELRKILDQLPL